MRGTELAPEAKRDGQEHYTTLLSRYIAAALFDRAGRDIESMGIGHIGVIGNHEGMLGLPDGTSDDFLANIIRILGQAKLFEGSDKWRTSLSIPRQVKIYIEKIATQSGCNRAVLEDRTESRLKTRALLVCRSQGWKAQLGGRP